MERKKELKTYSKNRICKSSYQAMNKLFVENLTKRKYREKKIKYTIKELPKRTNYYSPGEFESFFAVNVSVDDLFDKLKNDIVNPVNNLPSGKNLCKNLNNISCSNKENFIKYPSFIKEVEDQIKTPNKKFKIVDTSSQDKTPFLAQDTAIKSYHLELEKSIEKTADPTDERSGQNLLINLKTDQLLQVPELNNSQSFSPIFTKSFINQMQHHSTPLNITTTNLAKNPSLVVDHHQISSANVQNDDNEFITTCITESINEVTKWESEFPKYDDEEEILALKLENLGGKRKFSNQTFTEGDYGRNLLKPCYYSQKNMTFANGTCSEDVPSSFSKDLFTNNSTESRSVRSYSEFVTKRKKVPKSIEKTFDTTTTVELKDLHVILHKVVPTDKSQLVKADISKELIVNLEKISFRNETNISGIWSTIDHNAENSSVIEISSDDAQELSDSVFEGSTEIIEDSENDTFDLTGCPPSNFNNGKLELLSGKCWRRSLYRHRKTSILSSFQTTDDAEVLSSQLSAVILPTEASSRKTRRNTILLNYAHASEINENVRKSNFERTAKEFSILTRQTNFIHSPSARDVVLKLCDQIEIKPFEEIYVQSELKRCKKIGEGVYGEVFSYSKSKDTFTVMKIIPIEGTRIVNGEKQKKFDEILPELTITRKLSELRSNNLNNTAAYCELQRICCVQGKYPKFLLKLWDAYDEEKVSENDSPSDFDEDQLYIILELANGGQDLEAFIFKNAEQSIAMFQQTAFALAVAEKELQFEHRDLHWGNVLIRSVNRFKIEKYKLNGRDYNVDSKGIEVTIIDYTLSRISSEDVTVFTNLADDPDLFTAKGDYQFDIYRLMKIRNENNWKKFTPHTNILWLHYIVKKAINGFNYNNTNTETHKSSINILKEYEKKILSFNSVEELITTSNLF